MDTRLPDKILKEPTHQRALGSKLREKGLLAHGEILIRKLIQESYLSLLELVDCDKIMADYNLSVRSGILMDRLWNIITVECWLRSINI